MFILDGISYDVGVAAVSREAKLEERYRITTADGKIHREVQGVYFTYQLTLGNIAKAAYDNLYAKLTEPVAYHSITVPYGAQDSLTFEALFQGVSDEIITDVGGEHYWDKLTVSFQARSPQGGDVR